MKHKIKVAFAFGIFGALFWVIGCATISTEKKMDVQSLDDRLKEKAKTMNMTVHGVEEGNLKGAPCALALNKVNSGWNWLDAVNAANSCFKNHNFEAVESLAKQLGIRDTSTPWGPYFMAHVALERGQLDRALWMTELSLKRAPELGVIHYLKGQILWTRQEYKSATGEFEKAVTYDDGIGPAHLILGQVYLRDQDYEKAGAQFTSALRFLPHSVAALNGQGESQFRLNHLALALEAYVRLTEIDETDGQYLTRIGELYEGPLNNPERAMHAYQKLHDLIKAGKVTKNIDPDNDAKIKELATTIEKSRSVASTQEKIKTQGGGK